MINALYELTLIYAGAYLIISFIHHILMVFAVNKQEQPPMRSTKSIVNPSASTLRIPPKANNLAAPLEDEKARTLLDASYSIRQLKKLASEAHIKGYGSMNKQQLLEVLGV